VRRALAVLLLLGVAGCDVGEPDEPPSDPSTVVVDPAPTDGGSGGSREYGDTGAQPDLLPGGGAAPDGGFRYRLRVGDDGCTVRRNGRPGGLDGLAWMLSSRNGTVTEPRGDRVSFRPRLRGTGVVALVLLGRTADGTVVNQVSNTVRVRCP
jgi:hypothetical protein